MSQVIAAVFLVVGASFCLLGAIGMLRMPDMFTRLHAATKTGTLGVGFIMLAAALRFQELDASIRAFLVVAFLFATAPIGAHVIARAAYFHAVSLWEGSTVDELKQAIEQRAASAPADAVDGPDNAATRVASEAGEKG